MSSLELPSPHSAVLTLMLALRQELRIWVGSAGQAYTDLFVASFWAGADVPVKIAAGSNDASFLSSSEHPVELLEKQLRVACSPRPDLQPLCLWHVTLFHLH